MRALTIVLTLLTVFNFSAPARAEDSLDDMLEPLRAKYQLPSLAAAVVKNGEIVAAGAVGERVLGSGIKVTTDDRYHLGSDTKAMTATLAGMLVEEGKLRWDSTIGDILGADLPKLRPKFKAITLAQLLSHTSGIPTDTDEIIALYTSPDAYDSTLTGRRLKMIETWGGKHDPSWPKSGKFQYANLGYITAGAMIEKAAGKPWERLMFERIFEPLGLKTAGLGAQSTFGLYDAPAGHRVDDHGKFTAYPWGEPADLPSALGPAGLAHMSIRDFAAWAAWNAAEGKRGPALVKPETLQKIHAPEVTMEVEHPKPGTPKSGAYAFGWGLSKFDWSDRPLLTHNGSNGMNFATVLVDVEHDIAIVMATNITGPNADPAGIELVRVLYGKYQK